MTVWKETTEKLRRLGVTVRHPTIDEFTSLSPRNVAPIYATYASTIVSMLDIHLDPPTSKNDPTTTATQPFQVLEAGTGHGSLTVHLARAVAAANPIVTRAIIPEPSKIQRYRAGEPADDEIEKEESDALQSWRIQRRAIIHTVDINPGNRVHADRLIKSYRGGMYWPHIDFHAGNVKEWVAERPETKPFLDAVLLDMPAVEDYISTVESFIKNRGQLLVFVPQITQIAACVQAITSNNLPLRLESVVELGEGISTGRKWDVRMANLKHSRTSKHDASTASPGGEADSSTTIPPMVCRPLVGELTRGGGFVGLWKKILTS